MTKETLDSRIASFQNKIEKANSTIEKKQKLMLDKLAKSKVVDDIERKHLEFQIQLLVEEISNKQKDIVDWKKSLSKYQMELMAMVSKKRDIPVLIEFLDRWKALNVDYFLGKAKLQSRKEQLDEIDNWCKKYQVMVLRYNSIYATVVKEHSNWGSDSLIEEVHRQENKLMAEIKETRNIYNSLRKSYKQFYGDVIMLEDYAERHSISYRESVEIYLQKEWEAKYDKLVNDVKSYIGEIVDCKDLKVSGRGELNGKIKGTDGECIVTTFTAGTNFKTYRRQQCFHYRCRITKIN